MFVGMRIRGIVLAAVILTAGRLPAANAAWVTIQNDTRRVIVVQTAIVVNGQVKRGKPIRLLPGEMTREFHQPPAVSLEVYDPQNPNKAILTKPLGIKNDNQKFSIAPTPNGASVMVNAVDPQPKKADPPPAPKKK